MTDEKINQEEKLFLMLKLDRARKRWRFWFFVLFLVTLVGILGSEVDNATKQAKELNSYIAKVKVEGIILDNEYRAEKLKEIAENENIKAVLLEIDSPGGAMVPGIELLEQLKEIAASKPLVVQMKSTAASAGFLISLAGDYVVANKATLTGSIGVLMPLVDATDFAEKIGVKSAEIASGDLKSMTSPFTQRSQKANEYLQTTVNDLQQIFMNEVVTKRNIVPEVKDLIADGRFLIGQQAYEYNLVDALGGQKEALDYLYTQKDISKELIVKEVSLKKPEKISIQDIIAEQLTSKISNKLSTIFSGYVNQPLMIVQ